MCVKSSNVITISCPLFGWFGVKCEEAIIAEVNVLMCSYLLIVCWVFLLHYDFVCWVFLLYDDCGVY